MGPLSVRDLGASYRRNGLSPRRALNGLSFELRAGEFAVLLGPNGSGKTTFLNVLTDPTQIEVCGDVLWRGRSILGEPAYLRARTASRIYQDPLQGGCAHLTVREQCELAGMARGKSKVGWTELKAELLRLGIVIEPDQQIRTLSGGQRQLVMLLLAVLSEPQLLLLDEPTSSLDAEHRRLVLEVIEKYASKPGHLTILVTHDLDEALRYGNRTLVLDGNGRLAADLKAEARSRLSREDLANWVAGVAKAGQQSRPSTLSR